jgi:transposase
LRAAEQDRADIAEAREEWRSSQPDLNPERLVFLDETGAKTNMVRLYGRAPRGQRLFAPVPYGHWMTTTFVAALRHDEITAPCVFDGPMNRSSFLTYVEHFLAPTLRQGDIVVMDNLASHKVKGVKEAIEQAGATVRYLPAYSPDLNPIEQAFRNSRLRCEKPRHEHSTPSSRPSRMPSTPSPPNNAQTTSQIQAIAANRENALVVCGKTAGHAL